MLERIKYSDSISIQPYVNQVELQIFHQQRALLDYCQENGIKVTGYGPLGGAFGLPGPNGHSLLENESLQNIAREINKSPAQVALRFLLQLSPTVNIIPKSITHSRILENFQLDFILSDDHVSLLRRENKSFRFYDHYVTYGVDLLSLGH